MMVTECDTVSSSSCYPHKLWHYILYEDWLTLNRIFGSSSCYKQDGVTVRGQRSDSAAVRVKVGLTEQEQRGSCSLHDVWMLTDCVRRFQLPFHHFPLIPLGPCVLLVEPHSTASIREFSKGWIIALFSAWQEHKPDSVTRWFSPFYDGFHEQMLVTEFLRVLCWDQ